MRLSIVQIASLTLRARSSKHFEETGDLEPDSASSLVASSGDLLAARSGDARDPASESRFGVRGCSVIGTARWLWSWRNLCGDCSLRPWLRGWGAVWIQLAMLRKVWG